MKKLMEKVTTIENVEVFPMKFKEFEEQYEEYCEENRDGTYGITFEQLQGFIPSKHLAIVVYMSEDNFNLRFQAIVLLEDGYVTINAEEGCYEPLFTEDMFHYKKSDKTFKAELKQQSQIFKTMFEQYKKIK